MSKLRLLENSLAAGAGSSGLAALGDDPAGIGRVRAAGGAVLGADPAGIGGVRAAGGAVLGADPAGSGGRGAAATGLAAGADPAGSGGRGAAATGLAAGADPAGSGGRGAAAAGGATLGVDPAGSGGRGAAGAGLAAGADPAGIGGVRAAGGAVLGADPAGSGGRPAAAATGLAAGADPAGEEIDWEEWAWEDEEEDGAAGGGDLAGPASARVDRERIEIAKCAASAAYLVDQHCWLEVVEAREWQRFRLWPAQYRVLGQFREEAQLVILKARQLGLTWLAVAYALWLMLFRPGSVVLLFSTTDDASVAMLERLRQMHARLPEWLRLAATVDNTHRLRLINRSMAVALPAARCAGRSFTASLAIMDEADHMEWFATVMTAVKPTVDAGGRLMVLSTANKARPQSEFKRIWRAAVAGRNSYRPVFLPWTARPERDAAWYAKQAADYIPDDLRQEYPATPEQALAPRESAARFPAEHLEQCHRPLGPLPGAGPRVPVPGLVVYRPPAEGSRYVISVDTSEGDLTSDYSPAIVWDQDAWEEVAFLNGRFEPAVLARYLLHLADWYAGAVICVERNNHGHAVHVALNEIDAAALGVQPPRIYQNPHDSKPGWLSNAKWKTLAMDHAAEVFRDGACIIHSDVVISELAGIQASSLAALPGQHDDAAMAAVIGLAALRWSGSPGEGLSEVIPPLDPLAGLAF